MSFLFSPITIRSIQLKNRLVVSPMCQYSSVDGFANDWHLVHLGSRAVGGAGLIISEAAAVSPEGRITPDDLGIWADEHIANLKRITHFIQQNGSVAGIQLAHAGRKASHRSPLKGGTAIAPTEEGGWQTVAPSAIPFDEGGPLPTALTNDGIEKVLADFEAAARRALDAGFQVVEIHAAHGYLLHEFMSPLSNQRTDNYGGSFENRIRLLLDVIARVQTVWPKDLPLFVRISATDWTEGGWTADDSVLLATVLKDKGVDVIDCSTGGNVPRASIPTAPGYQVSFADRIKNEAGMTTAAVGLITSVEQAEAILANGQADLILLAREFLRSPYFPLQAAHELEEDMPWPVQYERAKPRKHQPR
ncbi:NADPH dehydrogenase NamA [Spirosoma utsteinense]|uniref:2,4-dienoyl-CoA reductase-like NADH-dependent reductase (Old Yellow Enzyme family) n=1 Tax=Spirosoma utsteinense TaxID=2585773 RepID=A0ABR6W585_9BACT|nr:NADPH dehydrogenase NamA [Spirosoma utsteinense]MBC3785617.1 2,4-dienoyl-CoA reductase-like NADH-dependent reductase (Old Yellow Enzyme family) [Spirosoma utsteinense]MBC3791768.1 2,4-dienoyl-CoA reductase-like NADH-dependent reductase (Old Yellow Enzyme family) [Spirosoma utsteinense]